ncbi:hypothetical protein DS691_21285 [Salmonella enterica subsp. enterica serovar Bareilly]|nr:hypothetical protein [Salmonella enterica subsp. enterica serovar Bareilly]
MRERNAAVLALQEKLDKNQRQIDQLQSEIEYQLQEIENRRANIKFYEEDQAALRKVIDKLS